MKSPDKDLTMTFRSVPMADKTACWEVKLVFPADSTAADRLRLAASDGNGIPVENGNFHFMGAKVDIANGEGSMLYRSFIEGIHQKEVWLTRPGCDPVPGGLTFE